MGPLGPERTLQLARERFWWPGLEIDINRFITEVCLRVKAKKPTFRREAPLQSITSTAPMDLIDIDFLHLDYCLRRL